MRALSVSERARSHQKYKRTLARHRLDGAGWAHPYSLDPFSPVLYAEAGARRAATADRAPPVPASRQATADSRAATYRRTGPGRPAVRPQARRRNRGRGRHQDAARLGQKESTDARPLSSSTPPPRGRGRPVLEPAGRSYASAAEWSSSRSGRHHVPKRHARIRPRAAPRSHRRRRGVHRHTAAAPTMRTSARAPAAPLSVTIRCPVTATLPLENPRCRRVRLRQPRQPWRLSHVASFASFL